jgi:hypothetical protein
VLVTFVHYFQVQGLEDISQRRFDTSLSIHGSVASGQEGQGLVES